MTLDADLVAEVRSRYGGKVTALSRVTKKGVGFGLIQAPYEWYGVQA